MKNIYLYYIAIFVPLLLIIFGAKTNAVSADFFLIAFFLYIFLYRVVIDGLRLVAKNAIAKKDIWKLIIPGSRFKYFKDLYLR